MKYITGPVRLFGLTGSLRRGSYSTAVLRGLEAAVGPDTALDIWQPSLPLYNEDEDGVAAPEAVRAFRRAMDASDGIVISTPEYNHGLPAHSRTLSTGHRGPMGNRPSPASRR